MISIFRLSCTAFALTVAAVSFGGSTSVTTEGALGANDYIDWSQFGYENTVGNIYSATGFTHNGIEFSISSVNDNTDVPDGAPFEVLQDDSVNNPWFGNFGIGDTVLYHSGSYASSHSDLKITFDTAVMGVGSAGQTASYGGFQMNMGAWDGASFLTSNPVGFALNTGLSDTKSNAYAFMGVLSTSANISSAYFNAQMLDGSQDSGAGWSHTLIVDGPASTPEPSSFLAIGLGAAVLLRRRKRS